MKTIKSIGFILGLLSISILTGCGESNSSSSISSMYPIYSGEETPLTYLTDSTFKHSYEVNEAFEEKGITVFYNGTQLEKGDYNLVSDKSDIYNSILTSESTFTSQSRTAKTSIYVTYLYESTMYISAPIELTITNSQAVDTWLYYTIGGLVIAALGVSFYIKSKAKREGRA